MPGFAELDRLSKPTPPKQVAIGFAFDHQVSSVALLKKTGKKEGQSKYAGWNAPGGHIEQGESALDAMRREFEEETGAFVGNWERFAVVRTPEFVIHCFRAKNVRLDLLYTREQEEVRVFYLHDLPNDTVYDVKWLLAMALNVPQSMEFEIHEHPVAA